MHKYPFMTLKNSIIAIFLLIGAVSVSLTSCNKSDDEGSVWETYRAWREYNENWLIEQSVRTNSDGTPYYKRCVMPTDPQAFILMHVIEAGSGELVPLFTSTTKVNYTLTLANDTIADQGDNFVSQLNSSTLITGWSLAIMQMHVGDSAQFIIPYNLGYGSSGSTLIRPYSNLQFNIRLTDITGYEIRP